MKVKELVKQDAGLKYAVDSMEFMSAAGRRCMLETSFLADRRALESQWDRLGRAIAATQKFEYKKPYIDLRHCLMQLHDLQGTLGSLAAHTVLTEVELFEIKNLALLAQQAAAALEGLGLSDVLPLPVTEEVFSLLDPDRTGIANFYIYDSYDPRLAPLRRELQALQTSGVDPQRVSDLLAEQDGIQNAVCRQLSDKLFVHVQALSTALEQMAYTDCLFAMASLCIAWNLSRPSVGDRTEYRSLVNPRLKARLEAAGMRYQPIDICIGGGVTLITGANMAGKTVLLKSVGTAQLMAQCGMYVPADMAVVCLVDDVVTSIGDDQDEMNGLSSFASEIIKISSIVEGARTKRLLVLIDEPARTTNPVEGKALVQAIVKILDPRQSLSLITTHYGQLGAECRRLRVKGFVEDKADVPLNPRNINLFIDYSLEEDASDEVPREAIRIAAILGCDAEMLDMARRCLAD